MLNMTSSSSHNQALHLTAQSLRSFTASELGRYCPLRDMDALLQIGFRYVGKWHAGPEGLDFALNDMADAAPVLYVFAVQGKPMYVGKSARSLKQRLYGYKKGGATQRTNIRIRKEIIAQLQQAQKVDIYAFASSESQTLGDFILNIPAALEDDIIRKLRPPWNGRRTEPYRDEAPPKAEESIEPQASTDQNQIAYQSFTVQIGEAYFSQGFFNVPVAHSDKFDRDGAAIRIYAGKNRTPVTGRINRRANNNNTPRIMGGTHLRDWIQANVGKGRLLKVIVEAKNQIALTKG